jgi:glycosyltransferase involved in cell wall biosynthesis
MAQLATPDFSILIAVRNGERYIAATLASVVQQSLPAFEIIIVNDGSTDNTVCVVEQFIRDSGDTRFRIINGAASGVSAARNLAMSQAAAPLILFLDADDLLAPDALDRFAVTLADAPNIAALGGIARIDENDAALPSSDNRSLVPQTDQLKALIEKNYIVNGGALAIRADAVRAAQGYTQGMTYGEDWEFWCRLLLQGDLAVVPGDRILYYRQVASGANYQARASFFTTKVPCLEAVGANPQIQARMGAQLGRLLKARQVDIYWAGVRSTYQYRSKGRALAAAVVGVFLYPSSLLRPDLAWRLVKSLKG